MVIGFGALSIASRSPWPSGRERTLRRTGRDWDSLHAGSSCLKNRVAQEIRTPLSPIGKSVLAPPKSVHAVSA